MLGIVYILNCIFLGYAIVSRVFKENSLSCIKSFKGRKTDVSRAFFTFPLAFVTGTLTETWAVYIFACLFRNSGNPLFLANAIVVPIGFAVAVFLLYVRFGKLMSDIKASVKRVRISEAVVFLLIFVLFTFFFFRTLYFEKENLHVGLSVFSDFSTHLSMVRSFSHGNNFPTQYTFFAGEDVKYHFMFQFLCGNLEYLGLRIDFAMNIPSLLSILSAYMAFYVLAVKISGKRAVGFLGMLLLTFRSSFTFFIFAGEQPQGETLENLSKQAGFIGSTNHEDWGLWNLNVYCNQRHFAFSLAVALLVVIMMLPAVFEAFRRLEICRKQRREAEMTRIISDAGQEADIQKSLAEAVDRELKMEKDEIPCGESENAKETANREIDNKLRKEKLKITDIIYADVWTFLSDSLLKREGWIPKSLNIAIYSGILLGLSAFWNGAVFFAVIMVLFFLAVVSDRRVEFLVMALIAGLFSLVQSKVFISDSLFDFKFLYGFLSDNRTFAGSIVFLIKLTGILLPLVFIAFFLAKGHYKYLIFCFSVPLIFAFYVSLTPDIAVNHKYVMFAIMLLDIPAADFLSELFRKRSVWVKSLVIICVFVMTVTGIYEAEILGRMNRKNRSFSYSVNDPLTEWVWQNTDRDDIFLTANYYLSSKGAGSSLILSGCRLFNGWQYFSWSAGYDTAGRDKIAAEIYSASDCTKLVEKVRDNGIKYIVVALNNRTSKDYALNEDTIAKTFGKVYSEGEGEYLTTVYDTEILLNAE